MACEAYDKLEKNWQRARAEHSYFACSENSTLRQTSDRQSKQSARTAREKISDLGNQIVLHQQICAECKGGSL
jgi:hypothetical protein